MLCYVLKSYDQLNIKLPTYIVQMVRWMCLCAWVSTMNRTNEHTKGGREKNSKRTFYFIDISCYIFRFLFRSELLLFYSSNISRVVLCANDNGIIMDTLFLLALAHRFVVVLCCVFFFIIIIRLAFTCRAEIN